MADLSQVEAAFLKADAAGDVDAARVLAAEVRRLRAVPKGAAEAPPPERRNIRGELVTEGRGIPKPLLELATGGTGLTRGALNLISKGTGTKLLPPAGDPESGWNLAGSLIDPASWALAGGIGKVLPFVPLMAKGIRGLPLQFGRNVASGAVTGGTIGALSDQGDTATGAGAGALAGAFLPPLLGGSVRAARGIGNWAYPSAGALGVKAAGDKADDVIAALKTAQSGVPGVELTAGQAAVPANSAEFAALQKIVSEKDPSRYFGATGSKGQQEAARQAAVREIGKTPAELQAAIEARATASGSNYEAAFAEVVKRDKDLREIWKNPYFRDEVAEAWKLLRAKGLPLKTNLSEFLHNVKLGMDAKLQAANNPNVPAISKATKNAIVDAKDKLVTWLEARNPAYETARLEHIAASKPISQMKFGQELEQALTAPISGAERQAAFGGAVRKAENVIDKATGRPRIEALTGQQRQLIDVIEEDLKRNTAFKELASQGRISAEKRIHPPTLLPSGLFMPVVSVARGWLNRLLGTGHENALLRLGALMEKNPSDFARLMEAATPQQRAAVESLLARYTTRGTIIGGASNLSGILGPQRGVLEQQQGVLSQ